MRIGCRNKYIGLALLFLFCRVPAQPLSAVDVIVAGSNGNGTVTIKGSESDLTDLAGGIRSAFQGRVRNELILPFSDLAGQSCFEKITTFFNACDSNDILITVWIGPWSGNRRNVTATGFLNTNEPGLTVDYLLNFIRLMPARNSFNFVIAPGRYSFPVAVLKGYARSAASGGKHLILMGALQRMSYNSMIEGFINAFEKMQEWKHLDLNRNGEVTASEWLATFEKHNREDKLTMMPYWLERGADIPLLHIAK